MPHGRTEIILNALRPTTTSYNPLSSNGNSRPPQRLSTLARSAWWFNSYIKNQDNGHNFSSHKFSNPRQVYSLII